MHLDHRKLLEDYSECLEVILLLNLQLELLPYLQSVMQMDFNLALKIQYPQMVT